MSPIRRLCHETRILLALIEAEEEAGPDHTGMFQYQRDKVYENLREVAEYETVGATCTSSLGG